MTTDYEVFEAGDVRLHSGETLADARLAYATHGTLNAAGDNAIVFATRVGGTHADNGYLVGPGHALDPDRWFIVVPNQLGNGLSSSPSNTPAPQDRARFPVINHHDNSALQHRLMTEVFGVEDDDTLTVLEEEVPEALQDKAREAERLCPRQAIKLEG